MAVAEATGSWADRLAGRIDRIPIPNALVYVAAWVGLLLAFEALEWSTGVVPPGTFRPLHVVLAALAVGLPGLIGLFNRAADQAVRTAAPLVMGGPERARELQAEIVRAPRLLSVAPAIAFIPIALVRIALNPGFASTIGVTLTPPAVFGELVFFPLVALSVSAYGVKLASLAWKVHRITTRELRVSVWSLGPLLQFSLLTARMAGSTLAIMVLIVISSPELFRDEFGIGGLLLALGLGLGVFVAPLLGLHARITRARQDAQADAARQMQRAIDDLRLAIDRGERAEMDPLNKAIGAVDMAQRAIDRVPTWPWSPETFRWVVGALMFPILLFLSQAILSRVLGS